MPAICRGDMVDVDVVHCSVPHRLEMSPDVTVNSIGISRQGELNAKKNQTDMKYHVKSICDCRDMKDKNRATVQ